MCAKAKGVKDGGCLESECLDCMGISAKNVNLGVRAGCCQHRLRGLILEWKKGKPQQAWNMRKGTMLSSVRT